MDRFAKSTIIALLCFSGCGPSSQPVAETPVENASAAPVARAPFSSATDVVSQFLDEIRRGGQDSRAHELLTQKAQAELKRIGRTVQPIGSPDAGFQVTRAELVPDEPDSALVHSIWSEPNGDGATSSDFQVVWAVEQEAGKWRISGLVMEVDPNQPPVIIDFENGEMMARLLATPDFQPSSTDSPGQVAPAAQPTGAASQAAASDPNFSR